MQSIPRNERIVIMQISVVMFEKAREMMRKYWVGLVFKIGMQKVRWW